MFDWNKEYETLDEIPEGARDAFEERDGKYALIKALSKAGLQSTLDKQKKEITELKALKKKFEVLDLTDEQIESLHDDLDELQSLRDLKESGQLGGDELEKRAKELVDARLEVERKKFEREQQKIARERDEATEALKGTRGKLHELTLDREALDIAAKKGVKTDYALRTVKRFVRDEFTVNDDGEILDRTDAGRSLSDWLDEEIASNPLLTADLKPGGSGAEGGNGRTSGGRTIKRADLDKLAVDNPNKAKELMASVKKGEASFVD